MTNTHPSNSVQAKVYTVLTGDSTLMALIGGVYDNPPDNTSYDYVTIGELTTGDWSSHTHQGFEGDLTIHTWCQARGRKNVNAIMNRIYTLLHNIDLSITGFPTIVFREAFRDTVVDPDGRTYHGVQRYTLILGGNNG